jgi:RHS repeat-associated protein
VARNAAATRIFSYDAAGNVIQDLRGASTYNYAINDAGRIKWVTGAGTASYLYDGFQKLRYRAQGGTVTNYVWDAFGHIIAEHNGAGGAALREYIWLGDTPLAVNEGVNLSYVHGDHLDRPVAMTTSGGPAIAWAAKYDPFGNVVSITSPTAMPLRFPGQYFQIEDGLSYNWHRNYDPSLGRFSQADPLGFVDGPGVYNYAGGSPAMRVDRDGRTLAGAITRLIPLLPKPKSPMCTAPSDAGPQPPLMSTPKDDDIPEFLKKPQPLPPAPKARKDCDDIYNNVDTPTCNGITRARGAIAGARCHASAAERYGAGLAGRPMQPLDIWNN